MATKPNLKRGVEAFVVLGQRKGGAVALETLKRFLPKDLKEEGRVCDLPDKKLEAFTLEAEAKAYDKIPPSEKPSE